MVAIVTCAVGVCCAVGIAIVCGNHFREKFVRWRKKRSAAGSSLWSTRHLAFSKDKQTSFQLQEVKVYQHGDSNSRNTIVIDSEFHPAEALRQMSMHKSEKDDSTDEADNHPGTSEQDSNGYITRLKNVRKVVDSGAFVDFKRGKISHMRCSPSGRWVVVCHEHACIVYDAEVSGLHFLDLGRRSSHVIIG